MLRFLLPKESELLPWVPELGSKPSLCTLSPVSSANMCLRVRTTACESWTLHSCSLPYPSLCSGPTLLQFSPIFPVWCVCVHMYIFVCGGMLQRVSVLEPDFLIQEWKGEGWGI